MENIQAILSLAGTALGLLITALTFLLKFIKNAKLKKAAEQMLLLTNNVVPLVKKAEKLTGTGGAEKKAYVMSEARAFAALNGIPFDAAAVCEKVEELVRLTKEVNPRDKDCTVK